MPAQLGQIGFPAVGCSAWLGLPVRSLWRALNHFSVSIEYLELCGTSMVNAKSDALLANLIAG
jgi:hypothetical protein